MTVTKIQHPLWRLARSSGILAYANRPTHHDCPQQFVKLSRNFAVIIAFCEVSELLHGFRIIFTKNKLIAIVSSPLDHHYAHYRALGLTLKVSKVSTLLFSRHFRRSCLADLSDPSNEFRFASRISDEIGKTISLKNDV